MNRRDEWYSNGVINRPSSADVRLRAETICDIGIMLTIHYEIIATMVKIKGLSTDSISEHYITSGTHDPILSDLFASSASAISMLLHMILRLMKISYEHLKGKNQICGGNRIRKNSEEDIQGR